MDDHKQIEEADIDALLRLLPTFESEDFCFGSWDAINKNEDGAINFPTYLLSTEASDFVGTLYEHGWVAPFDWSAWQKEAERLVASPDALNAADVETIRKLLTLHVRKERFCEGHLSAMFECGHLTNILRRLHDLRGERG